jgi:hypothetical protein
MQWSGPNCAVPTTSTGCQNNSALEANTGQQTLAGGSQSGATIDTLTESVLYNITSPNLLNRNYTYFNWGRCDSNRTVSGGLNGFAINTKPTDCNDTWTFSWRVADLEPLCQLDKLDDPPGRPNTVRYRGDLNIYYLEWAEINQNQRLRRTGRLVTPVDVFIDRLGIAELNTTNATIFVYSTFEVKAAITATNIKANSTTSYVDITIGIPAPYAVIQVAAGNPLPSQSNNETNPDVAWSCILQNKGQRTQSCTPVATWDNGSGLSDCISV